jgi:HEAT repeat protein
MKKRIAAAIMLLFAAGAFSQNAGTTASQDGSAEDAKRLETIRYGTETEIAALIQTLKTENTDSLDDELVTVAKNTHNRNILSGVFSFFGDRKKGGLEDRALQAIGDLDDEANETVLAALDYLGKVESVDAAPLIRELLDAEERPFINACIKALGLIGGAMSAGASPGRSDTAALPSEPPPPEAPPGETAEAENKTAAPLADASEDAPDQALNEAADASGEAPGDAPDIASDGSTDALGETADASNDAPGKAESVSGEEGKKEARGSGSAPRTNQESAAALAEYLIDYYNQRIPGSENRRDIIIALGDVKSPAGIPLLREIAENSDEQSRCVWPP